MEKWKALDELIKGASVIDLSPRIEHGMPKWPTHPMVIVDATVTQEHDGYFFENEQTSEFFDYGEAISCRVGFDHHLTKKGKEDYIDKCDYTLYLHMKDGEYKIYYMVTH